MINVDEIQREVKRLSDLSAWPGCPGGGWQYPFDFGNGIVAPPYGPVQATLHPWRRKVLLDNLDPIFGNRYHELSVLDLGSCEGAMAIGLWERGVRDITCVETRAINVEKARFVAKVKGCNINIIQADIFDYLQSASRTYDLVLFMGILYHLLNPFDVSKLVAKSTKTLAVYETVLALPNDPNFKNVPEYSPTSAGFFIRIDSSDSNTAGLSDLEFWPNRHGLDLLLKESGFVTAKELDYGPTPDAHYSTGQRIMLFAHK